MRVRAGIVALLAMALVAASCSDSESSSSTTVVEDCVADGSCAEGPAVAVADDAGTGIVATEEYLGLPAGFTPEGYPFLGNPDASVTLVEYSDYLCPFCLQHTTLTTPTLLLEYGLTNQVRFEFRDYPIAQLHPTAPIGHAASLCVAEQGAELFWTYHDDLFGTQSEWANLPDPAEYLLAAAERVGADVEAYQECVASGRTTLVVNDRVAQGAQAGVSGTPSFRLVGADGASYDLVGAQPLTLFQQYLDALLAGEVPAGAVATGGPASGVDPVIQVPTFEVDPNSVDTYDGLPVGFTTEGFPYIGDPEAAVSLIEYSDYLCPFCFRHTTQTVPQLLSQYAAAGDVNFVFRDFPLVGLHPTAPSGHNASRCVAEQGAAFFWAFHDSLFFNQQQWSGLADPAGYLAETARTIGVDMGPYEECVASGRNVPVVEALVAEARAAGFNGTPSFLVVNNDTGDAYELIGALPVTNFQSYLDAVLAGEEPTEAVDTEEQSSELPFWANAGLAPDPARSGYNLAGDPYKGDPDAPLVVIEFADFQCPSCQRHALDVQPSIDETFIDSGDIMWVFKNFPLQEHPQALVAGAAAECAGEQDRFWDMHHALFEESARWAVEDADPALVSLATGLGLNTTAFRSCLSGRKALERVITDRFEGEGIIERTPTFLLLYGGVGRQLEGARDLEAFTAILEVQVEAAREAANG